MYVGYLCNQQCSRYNVELEYDNTYRSYDVFAIADILVRTRRSEGGRLV